VSSPTENGQDIEEMTEDRDEEERFSGIRYISTEPTNPNYLYLASTRGVYQSQDRGKTWGLLSDAGLLNRGAKFLLLSKEAQLYAATKSGVFEYKQGGWKELSFGLTVEEINYLTLDSQDNLYAACDKGLFKTNTGYFVKDRQDDIASLYIKDEPEINEVQQAAIRYAEVYPEKIERWRKQAAKKAWLPQVSLGVNRNTTDLWHWEGGSTTKTDDDILRRGRDSIDWDVTLSWNLGELIWNDDQTNIDVRSKLMVQLRHSNISAVVI
jgi:ligand-binding sensor domain-containing protein